MRVRISKWGNSLGLRLPRALAEQIGVVEGQKVNITTDGARLIIEPAPAIYRIDDLLTNMTPNRMRLAFDWGGEVGRERVGE